MDSCLPAIHPPTIKENLMAVIGAKYRGAVVPSKRSKSRGKRK